MKNESDTGIDGVLITDTGQVIVLQIIWPKGCHIRRTLSESRQPFVTPQFHKKLEILAVLTGMSLDQTFDYLLYRGIMDACGLKPTDPESPAGARPHCRHSKPRRK